ncbi:MAG: ribonuclease HIII, partial [candidate division Zixibacteria bacterium RBG_16_40_9]
MSKNWIGTDESGKGDYFGPLVIAGVFCNLELEEKLRSLNVRDSKVISDNQVKELSEKIKQISPFNLVVIGPEKYNQLYDKMKNLNKLLAWGHARVIENLLNSSTTKVDYVISDKFGDERYIQRALMEKGKKVQLLQKVKAESDLGVAAASIIARAEFLRRLQELSHQYDLNLPKGS